MQSGFILRISFILIIISGRAAAADIGLEAGMFIERNPNINLVPENPVEETITRSYAEVRVIEQGAIFESRTDAKVLHYTYNQDAYPSGTIKSIDTLNTFTVIPKRLNFNLDDHLAYVPIDNTAFLLPTNQQQINLFSLGPSLAINISPVDSIEALYNKQRYSEQITNYDNKRDLVSTRIIHKFDRFSELAVNYQYQNTDFDNNYIHDNKRSDIFLSYLNRTGANQYSLEAGVTKIKFDEGVIEDGGRFRLNLLRQINVGNSIQVSYRNELSDITNELGFSQLVSSTHPVVISSVPISNTGDVFRIKTVSVDYMSTSYPAQLHLGYTNEMVDYYQTPNDFEDDRFNMDYTFPILERVTLTAAYIYTNRNFLDLSRNYHIANGRLTLNYHISRDIFISGYMGYEENNSSDPAYDYRNKLYGIGLVYQTENMRSIHLERETMPGGIQ